MRQRIKQLIATTFNVPATAVPDDATADTFDAWSSLGHLELMMNLEMDFNVRIPTELMPGLNSVEAIEDYPRSQGVAD